PFTTRDTVPTETPASFATSLAVTRFARCRPARDGSTAEAMRPAGAPPADWLPSTVSLPPPGSLPRVAFLSSSLLFCDFTSMADRGRAFRSCRRPPSDSIRFAEQLLEVPQGGVPGIPAIVVRGHAMLRHLVQLVFLHTGIAQS